MMIVFSDRRFDINLTPEMTPMQAVETSNTRDIRHIRDIQVQTYAFFKSCLRYPNRSMSAPLINREFYQNPE